MRGTVFIFGEHPLHGKLFGVRTNDFKDPILIPNRERDIRKLQPGEEIVFRGTTEQTVRITSPKPVIGCERKI